MNIEKMATDNTILRCLVGSQAYGLSAPEGVSDRDEKGVCIETMEAHIGFSPFEQYEFRSASQREGRNDAKSQGGDLDLTIYSLKKFLRLALNGNPSVIELLFIPDPIVRSARGAHLQELAPYIVSRRAGKAFLGYMESQKQRLVGELGQKKVNRPELEEKYGFDTKYAMHILRLGIQGGELLTTGRLTLPMEEGSRTFLRGVREGRVPLQEVLTVAGSLERDLKDLLDTSPLPPQPDYDYVENWMIEAYWEWWKAERVQLELAKMKEMFPRLGEGGSILGSKEVPTS